MCAFSKQIVTTQTYFLHFWTYRFILFFIFFSKSIVYKYFMSSVIDLSLEMNLLFEKILLDLTEEAKL